LPKFQIILKSFVIAMPRHRAVVKTVTFGVM